MPENAAEIWVKRTSTPRGRNKRYKLWSCSSSLYSFLEWFLVPLCLFIALTGYSRSWRAAFSSFHSFEIPPLTSEETFRVSLDSKQSYAQQRNVWNAIGTSVRVCNALMAAPLNTLGFASSRPEQLDSRKLYLANSNLIREKISVECGAPYEERSREQKMTCWLLPEHLIVNSTKQKKLRFGSAGFHSWQLISVGHGVEIMKHIGILKLKPDPMTISRSFSIPFASLSISRAFDDPSWESIWLTFSITKEAKEAEKVLAFSVPVSIIR